MCSSRAGARCDFYLARLEALVRARRLSPLTPTRFCRDPNAVAVRQMLVRAYPRTPAGFVLLGPAASTLSSASTRLIDALALQTGPVRARRLRSGPRGTRWASGRGIPEWPPVEFVSYVPRTIRGVPAVLAGARLVAACSVPRRSGYAARGGSPPGVPVVGRRHSLPSRGSVVPSARVRPSTLLSLAARRRSRCTRAQRCRSCLSRPRDIGRVRAFPRWSDVGRWTLAFSSACSLSSR